MKRWIIAGIVLVPLMVLDYLSLRYCEYLLALVGSLALGYLAGRFIGWLTEGMA